MTLRQFFSQDKVSVGILAGVAVAVGYIVVLTIGLLIAHEPLSAHLRLYGGLFIPLILLLRHYAKTVQRPRVVKTLATLLFITFTAFMFLLFQTQAISIQ